MLAWLSGIGESIGIFLQFISSTLSGILSVFALVGQSFTFLSAVWYVLPSVLQVFVPVCLTVSIVFLLIGR